MGLTLLLTALFFAMGGHFEAHCVIQAFPLPPLAPAPAATPGDIPVYSPAFFGYWDGLPWGWLDAPSGSPAGALLSGSDTVAI